VTITNGVHRGKHGHYVGLIGDGEGQVIEVQLDGEPQSTFHRANAVARVFAHR
jgi:hypothetical protein